MRHDLHVFSGQLQRLLENMPRTVCRINRKASVEISKNIKSGVEHKRLQRDERQERQIFKHHPVLSHGKQIT